MTKTIYDLLYVKLIDHIRRRRREVGLRQEDVAARLGVPRSWIGKIESRERRLDVLELHRLCQVYGLSLAEITARLVDEGEASDR